MGDTNVYGKCQVFNYLQKSQYRVKRVDNFNYDVLGLQSEAHYIYKQHIASHMVLINVGYIKINKFIFYDDYAKLFYRHII